MGSIISDDLGMGEGILSEPSGDQTRALKRGVCFCLLPQQISPSAAEPSLSLIPPRLKAPFTSQQAMQSFLEGVNSSELLSREPAIFREKPQAREIWEGREGKRDQACLEGAAKQLGELSVGLYF